MVSQESAANPRERSDGFTAERKRLFLVAIGMAESVLGACALVGVSNRTAYNHRRRDPQFARDWELARGLSWMPLDLIAFERAVHGVEEPVYAYGKHVHTRVRRSDDLLKALLIAEQPRKYGRAAGLKAERKRLEKRLAKRIEAELALRAELEALRTLRNSDGGAVNFVKAPLARRSPPQRPSTECNGAPAGAWPPPGGASTAPKS